MTSDEQNKSVPMYYGIYIPTSKKVSISPIWRHNSDKNVPRDHFRVCYSEVVFKTDRTIIMNESLIGVIQNKSNKLSVST